MAERHFIGGYSTGKWYPPVPPGFTIPPLPEPSISLEIVEDISVDEPWVVCALYQTTGTLYLYGPFTHPDKAADFLSDIINRSRNATNAKFWMQPLNSPNDFGKDDFGAPA